MSRATEAAQRFPALDALRGLAMVWMTLFHFCFDLVYFGLLQADFYQDRFWTVQRTCILSLFLACLGASQVLALHQGLGAARFWRRWLQIALCALAVSVGSYAVFPRSYIYFGVLHGAALMLLLVRCWPLGQGARLLLGALALAAPSLALQAHAAGVLGPALDSRAWNWLGLVSHKPVTEDYVPLLPWLGVVLWAEAAMQWLLRHHSAWLLAWPAAGSTVARLLAPLATLGRWSLSYYMLHQPVLLALLSAGVALRAGGH